MRGICIVWLLFAGIAVDVSAGTLNSAPLVNPERETYEAWVRGLNDHLVELDVDWVTASLAVTPPAFRGNMSYSREELLASLAERPVLGSAALGLLAPRCGVIEPGWCDAHRIMDRLAAAEPDNGYAILAPLMASQAGDDQDRVDQLLLHAAEARHFTPPRFENAMELVRYIQAYAEAHPPEFAVDHGPPEYGWSPEISDAQIARLVDSGPELVALKRVSLEIALTPRWTASPLFEACTSRAQARNEDMVNACLEIAQRMAGGPDKSAVMRGSSLEIEIRRIVDPDDPEIARLEARQQLLSEAEHCRLTGLYYFGLVVNAPSLRAYIQDSVGLGGIEASRNAALRDYAAHPERWPYDPAECDRIVELEGEEAEAFLAEREAERRAR